MQELAAGHLPRARLICEDIGSTHQPEPSPRIGRDHPQRRRLIPNPPMDTDGRREDSGRGVRELQGRWPGLHWGRWEVGGRSSVAAQGPYGRLRELRCAGWRENTQQGTARGPGWREFAGTSVVRWAGRWQTSAVRLGVEWLGAGPGRGRTSPATASSVADAG